jgi:hypothetical protein
VGPKAANYLNVETGRFSADPAGDLYFCVYPEKSTVNSLLQAQVLIKGINGAKIFQGQPDLSLTGNLTSFEQIFRIAPQNGYQDEIVVKSRTIYVSAHNGNLFVRMTIETTNANRERTGTSCFVDLFVNSTGSRELE